jgi:hypothetical protein
MEPVFELLKIWHLRFQKILKKILEVYSSVFYSTAKYQNEIVCIPPYTKRLILSNLKNFEFFTVHHLRSENLSFLRSLKYTVIRVDFLHTCRVHHYLHTRFFSDFLETSNCRFQKSSKKGSREPVLHIDALCFSALLSRIQLRHHQSSCQIEEKCLT